MGIFERDPAWKNPYIFVENQLTHAEQCYIIFQCDNMSKKIFGHSPDLNIFYRKMGADPYIQRRLNGECPDGIRILIIIG